MYRFISAFLSLCLLTAGGFYVYERYSHLKTKRNSNNSIARLEGTIQETTTAYSVRGVELENLRSQNSELQGKIDDRDEEIASLLNVNLKLKNEILKSKNAKESEETGPSGEKRARVDFEMRYPDVSNNPLLAIYGHTLTNPAYSELSLVWLRAIELDLILAKSGSSYRFYLDTKDSNEFDGHSVKLNLSIDPSVFEKKWYEKLGVGLDISAGEGVQGSFRLFYDVLSDIYFGPNVTLGYDGIKMRKMYGASVGWYPFRSK